MHVAKKLRKAGFLCFVPMYRFRARGQHARLLDLSVLNQIDRLHLVDFNQKSNAIRFTINPPRQSAEATTWFGYHSRFHKTLSRSSMLTKPFADEA
jgi:hypothetical protein